MNSQSNEIKDNHQIDHHTIELMYDEIKEKLQSRISSIKTLETKAHSIMSLVGVITGLGITWGQYLTSKAVLICSGFQKISMLFTYIAGMFIFLLSVCFAFLAYKVESYRMDPDPKKLIEKYFYYPQAKVLEQLLDNFADSYIENGKILSKKAKYVSYSLFLFIVGLFIIFIFMILFILVR